MKQCDKMKNSYYRYEINRPRPKHGLEYTNNIKLSRQMSIIYIKQQLSNI